MAVPEIQPVGTIGGPHVPIWAPDAVPGDVLLVREYGQIWCKTVTASGPSFEPPSLSRTGWTFLAGDPGEDKAWIISGVESIDGTDA